jgi:hypothetical protein
MQAAGNRLNIVVLDACRDNPFSWARSGQRGLSVVASQPPGSIIAYATSAGSVAGDGDGRNGIFTGELLRILGMPGIDVSEIFRLTGQAVQERTAGKQIPAIYSQFFEKKTLLGGQDTVIAPSPKSTSVTSTVPMQTVYTIGSGGPAGGYIFYDKGNYSDGWRYLEAAPVSNEFSGRIWGGYGTAIGGTGTAIGTGAGNTEKIVAKFGNTEPFRNKTDYAAKLCADLVVVTEGKLYDDWFLPSKDELNQMYQMLKKKSLGGFSFDIYWSSSESNANRTWGQFFLHGLNLEYIKFFKYRIRPVRAF